MTDRITTFNLHWYNRGCSCVDSVLHEEITIYRRENLLVFFQYNGYKSRIATDRIKLNKEEVKTFFEFLEKYADKWEPDYSVEVCDGSEWKVLMRHSSLKVTKSRGTVEYPPYGKQIEEYIRSFIENRKSLIDPQLFGCGRSFGVESDRKVDCEMSNTLADLRATVCAETMEQLEGIAEEQGLSVGEVLDRLVLKCSPDDTSEAFLLIMEYISIACARLDPDARRYIIQTLIRVLEQSALDD